MWQTGERAWAMQVRERLHLVPVFLPPDHLQCAGEPAMRRRSSGRCTCMRDCCHETFCIYRIIGAVTACLPFCCIIISPDRIFHLLPTNLVICGVTFSQWVIKSVELLNWRSDGDLWPWLTMVKIKIIDLAVVMSHGSSHFCILALFWLVCIIGYYCQYITNSCGRSESISTKW